MAKNIFGNISNELIKVNTQEINAIEELHLYLSFIEIVVNNIWSKNNSSIRIAVVGDSKCIINEPKIN